MQTSLQLSQLVKCGHYSIMLPFTTRLIYYMHHMHADHKPMISQLYTFISSGILTQLIITRQCHMRLARVPRHWGNSFLFTTSQRTRGARARQCSTTHLYNCGIVRSRTFLHRVKLFLVLLSIHFTNLG